MLPKCTRTCLWPSRNRIWTSWSNFLFFGFSHEWKGGKWGGGKLPFLQRGSMVSGVSYIETGTGKCSFQGCIPTGNSGLWSGWEDASLCLAEPSYTCWVSRFNCHHCMAEGVLAGQAQAAVELPCLLPCSPGHLWSPGPLSTWVGLPLAASAPSPWTVFVWTLLGPLLPPPSVMLLSRWGSLRSYYRTVL